jgi:hypothetical protein
MAAGPIARMNAAASADEVSGIGKLDFSQRDHAPM